MSGHVVTYDFSRRQREVETEARHRRIERVAESALKDLEALDTLTPEERQAVLLYVAAQLLRALQ